MNSIFKLDGPVFTILNKFCDVLILSILWLVFCFPLITIGPASAALYHTAHKSLLHSEGYVLSTFWKSFRANLKQGILLTLLCVPVSAFCVVSYFFSDSLGRGSVLGAVYFAVTILVSLFLLIMLTYTFPVLSRFYMTVPQILMTSVALAVTRIGFTLLLIVILLLCVFAVWLAPFTGFVLPACYAMAAERLIEPAFKKALDAREKAAQEESASVEK